MGLFEELDIVKKERYFALGLILFIIVFTIFDIFEDLQEGSNIYHVSGELTVVGLCLLFGIYLWRRILGVWETRDQNLKGQLSIAQKDAAKWKAEIASLAKGISSAIDQQLEAWVLSNAEKEVAFSLIKGLSFKEVADIRSTSEHTVRQQAATIYRKSGLQGRAQLSAFFLEDLLILDSKPEKLHSLVN